MPTRRASALTALLLVALGASAAAQQRRPTPHEALDRAVAPVRAAIDAASPTEAERRDLADVLRLAEAAAAELVAAEHRRLPDLAAARRRRIERLAEAARARIEATRAEAEAQRAERLALETEARSRSAQGALERAAERRRAATAGREVSTWSLPALGADAGAAQPTDAGASP